MAKIRENGVNYVTLRIQESYYIGNHYVKDMWCIQGQREDTLNWDFISKSIPNRDEAVLEAIRLVGNTGVTILENGYQLKETL